MKFIYFHTKLNKLVIGYINVEYIVFVLLLFGGARVINRLLMGEWGSFCPCTNYTFFLSFAVSRVFFSRFYFLFQLFCYCFCFFPSPPPIRPTRLVVTNVGIGVNTVGRKIEGKTRIVRSGIGSLDTKLRRVLWLAVCVWFWFRFQYFNEETERSHKKIGPFRFFRRKWKPAFIKC